MTDYDPHADFGRYHAHYWIGVRAGNSLTRGRGNAAVSAFGKVNQTDTLETFYDGFPGWGWRGWGGGQASDIWTGSPGKNKKKLDHVVADMFKRFPPPPQT